MNGVFPVDDFSDPFWQSPANEMNRSASEWDLEMFLEGFSGGSTSSSASDNNTAPSTLSQSTTSSRRKNCDDDVVEILNTRFHHPTSPPTVPHDSDEYRKFLKSKLYWECAAVAMSGVLGAKIEDFPSLAKGQRLDDVNFPLGSQDSGTGCSIPTGQNIPNGESVKIQTLHVMQKHEETQVRQTTSGSSKEDSEDDDLEGDTGTNEDMDPVDAKRARRMQSNRESARRSRKRKQAQLNELESQVGQLRDEHSSLLSRHTDINKKCDEAVVNNRILRANVETLRAKVKMAEEQVKRVTGLNPMLLARSNLLIMAGQVDGARVVTGPVQPNSSQFFPHPKLVPNFDSHAPHLQTLNNGFPTNPAVPVPTTTQNENGSNNISGMSSVPPTAGGQSMINKSGMPKQIDPLVGSCEPLLPCDSRLPHVVAMEKERK
ncbi:hypothetical protein K2173_018490 [Erythroxylum novogranatense]|uniref:BZIP domain-containing protein n=1 Tax=Erythroxylum novogranatense TaxID=1862640 RepID=A0AAV8UFC6_9ROSI|nr:hypothetical protein K2173_018490 [Erythroxylum novogranatense]